MENQRVQSSSISLPSIIAILAAIGSFFAGAFWGLLLALVAIVFAIIGVLLSFSSRYRGGIISIFSLLLGVAGFILGVIKAIAYLV